MRVTNGVTLQPGDEARVERREPSPLIAETALMLVIAYVLSFWLALDGSQLREAVLLSALALAACAAVLALRRALRLERVVWWAIPFFCVLLAAGEGGRLVAGYLGAGLGSRWLVSGVFALLAYSLLIIAMLRSVAGDSPLALSLGLIDSAMVGLAVAAPWVRSAVAPRIGEHGGLALYPQLVVPVLAAVVLVLIGLAVWIAPETEISSFTLIAAIAAGLAAELLVVRYLLANGSRPSTQGALLGSALLIVVAAELTGRSVRVRQRGAARIGVARLTVVLIAFAISLV
ncbi:MAG TPA: hypothetical protein VII05_01645, partial [Gaiellaceae bacterium]